MRSRDAMPFAELSSFIEGQLKTPLVERGPALRLRRLTCKMLFRFVDSMLNCREMEPS